MVSLRQFNYTNSKGEKNEHSIFALSETPDYLMGIDINKALELVIDANDKDFKGAPEVHSPWCFNLIRLDNSYPDDKGETHICFKKASLMNIAASREVWETESPNAKEQNRFYYAPENNLVLYNNDHSEIDVSMLVDFIKELDLKYCVDFVNAIDDAASDDSSKFYLFALNLNWFSLACPETYKPTMPGFHEMCKRYKAMNETLLLRKPTQYKDLKESRTSEKQKIAGFDDEWMKAFKNFKKSGIEKIN